MPNGKKISLLAAIVLMVLGAIALWGVQSIMHKTNDTKFCLSCHSMEKAHAEYEGSAHFANQKGIRAECSDCHVPQEGLHYLKAKVVALKDVWYTITNKLPDDAAYEKHRLEMAQRVWNEMKANDSVTCRSCHSLDAMELHKQPKIAQDMHKSAAQNGQTCIDCHKGVAHFMPEMDNKDAAGAGELAKHAAEFSTNDKTLYALAMSTAQLINNQGEVRLMPYAELTNWKEDQGNITATIHGWQQVGAESVVYMGLGQRIMVALLDDDAQTKVKVLKTQHNNVTGSDWKEITFDVNLAKDKITANLTALNQFGNNLNQTHCSGCHAPIGADHYTANQWIGVVNSMKDRTSMNADDVRAVTIYLQRNAKDMVKSSH